MSDNDQEPGYWIEVHPTGWPHRRIPTPEPVTRGWRAQWVRWDGPEPVPLMPTAPIECGADGPIR